jgi:formylglycine-generating enzyme required for sulfatase activity/energy-coupling factor transporter ATP-binding protein EcfA2
MNERTPEYDLFLSYNRLDRKLVDRLAEALRERGLKVFKDDWYLRPGEPWPIALERNLAASRAVAVAVGRNGLGPWQQREAAAALDQQVRRPPENPLPVIPVLLDHEAARQVGLVFLLQNTWVEHWDPRAPDIIVGAVQGKAPAELYDSAHADPRSRICPYRGLGVFREEDAGFYFGREPDLERLLGAIERHPLVAIVGPSGSGKSSLARAGLIPRLRRPQGGKVYQIADMRPGRNPFLALARSLLPQREPERILDWSKDDIDDQCERLENRLEQKGAEHLAHVVGQIMEGELGTTQLVLLVDQWEELYTYRPSEPEAAETHRQRVRRFIEMLLEGVRGRALRVILTVRADFWGELLNDAPLAARLPDAALVHLRALERAALARVIRQPAEQTRLAVPSDLTEVLLDATVGQPGDLPLLEFALQQLWDQRGDGDSRLTLAAYRAIGGLESAIVNRADSLYAELDPDEREAVPGVFAALVQVGEARTDLRRRARLGELSAAGQAVVRRFADARLLVTGCDLSDGAEWVEVAHEALLRHWPRLEKWIGARRAALLTLRQLQADTRTWLEQQKSPSYLWSHERAREAANALKKLEAEVVLSAEEAAFLGPVDPAAMLAELESPETSHRRRALIGERLGVLGDPRSGVGVDPNGTPEIAWCTVAGGEVAIRVGRRLLGGTKPLRRTIADFRIARYPITVTQYRAFLLADDGWGDHRWWAEDLYRDQAGNTYDVGRQGNRPAVYVSWFDAVAFCRWLSQRTGLAIRLPDEWEWQRAATGGPSADGFPWGSDWDPKAELDRANTFESRLGATTAVGMYPAGASPVGALDMAGTVWEWCLNKHDNPQITRSRGDDFDRRVVRGGSWGDVQDFARSAARVRSGPGDRGGDLGFRVLCASPIPGH